MGEDASVQALEIPDVAGALRAIARLLETMHAGNIQVQQAVAHMMDGRSVDRNVIERLQALDLQTQVNADLSQLLPLLADVIDGQSVDLPDAVDAMTLHALRNAVFMRDENRALMPDQGDVALF